MERTLAVSEKRAAERGREPAMPWNSEEKLFFRSTSFTFSRGGSSVHRGFPRRYTLEEGSLPESVRLAFSRRAFLAATVLILRKGCL
jgi:hypothetical protein